MAEESRRLVNAGTHPDAIAVKGCKSSNGFTVKYLKGKADVTTNVTAGTIRPPYSPRARARS